VIGQTMGSFHHGSTSEGVASFWKMGKDSNIWDTELKTDMEWVTKKDPGSEAHSLPYFDAIVFVNTTGNWKLDDEQKEALLSFIRDDGKGLVLVHAAIDSNYNWPEWAEMTGAWFNGHPWGTFEGPIIVEDQSFPAMRHFPKYLKLHDEMYSTKNWSRDKVNVLMRLDESKLNYTNPRAGSGPPGGATAAGVAPPAGGAPGAARAGAPAGGGAQGRGGGEPSMRTDKDQAVAWAKMYGKGRVFYSTFGHTKEAWENPDILKMYTEAVKWVMGLTEGSTASHAKVN
jgi:type 1 glutamine amidotransferase